MLIPFLLAAAAAQATTAEAPADHVLAWSDEFETSGLPDPTKWSYDTARNAEGWYNDEAQYYSANRAKNARVENGVLILEAHREDLDKAAFPDWGGQHYTSARLLSPLGVGMHYGFYEVRAKLPCGRGTWPAIWMLPEMPAADWPMGGEIDIMEQVGHEPTTIHGTVHTGAYNHMQNTHKTNTIDVPTACGEFHDYQLRWTVDAIEVGVDDKVYFRFENDGKGELATWPYDRPFRFILNVAVGGWGGDQGIDDAAFPRRMEVDYVRYYKPVAASRD